MSKNLVIVESPAKARTIGRILPSSYDIKASMGHIRDLPENSFGVDIEHGFQPQYEESRTRGRNLNDLKNAAKSAQDIYLASDPDREGEAIAWHLQEVLRKSNPKARFHRVSFHEITRSAINRAFEQPGEVNMNRVDAQQARRVLDRIVGYQISPLLWSRIERGISAGRVQSVALRLVCEREREIQSFVPREYWVFQAKFHPADMPDRSFLAKLHKIDGKAAEVPNQEEADRLLALMRSAPAWVVRSVDVAPRRKSAPPPFITSTLQQAASSAMGFSANQTMQTAQQLYEGVELSAGPVGLITYMRTDSVAIAREAQAAARAYIEKTYGRDYVPEKPNFFRSKANAQGAHEAIRPTDVNLTPDSVKRFLSPAQYKLYTLIWRRFVACQMAPAQLENTTATVENDGPTRFSFRASSTVVKFPGFQAVYDIREESRSSGDEDEESSLGSSALAFLKTGMGCAFDGCKPERKFTEPAPRYSEATLIKELESNGIGRPSTYAAIVNTIQVRKYVAREKGRLAPTELGMKVNDYLVHSLPELFQVGFTARMEEKLDSVEEGQTEWTAMLRDFYDSFEGWLKDAKFADSPESEKAKALVSLLRGVKTWEKSAPAAPGKRAFNERTFFNSIATKQESGAPLTLKQWNALLSIAAKYEAQLPELDDLAKEKGFLAELNEARERRKSRDAAAEERKSAGKDEPFVADPRLDSIFKAGEKVQWAKPEKVRNRVYDDGAFFDSLRKQYRSGKTLSPKQISALSKMIKKYADAFPDNPLAPAKTDPPNPERTAQIESLLKAFQAVRAWKEPVVRRGRTFSDKDFVESLEKQHQSGRALSDRQIAALRKLAERYELHPA